MFSFDKTIAEDKLSSTNMTKIAPILSFSKPENKEVDLLQF